MNKNLIIKRFSRSLNSYNDNAEIQYLMAKKIVSLLNKDYYNNILEIGCGTGLLTQELIKNIKFNKYIANDIVPECKDFIDKISKTIKFINCDIEDYINQINSNNFDLIISNATVQWIDKFEDFFERAYQKLATKGTLLFSVFGEYNFKEIKKITGKALNYHSIDYYKEFFKNKNFDLFEEIYELPFNHPVDILKHFKYTGVNALTPTKWTKKDLENFENKYNRMCNDKPILTYHPIYIKITKN